MKTKVTEDDVASLHLMHFYLNHQVFSLLSEFFSFFELPSVLMIPRSKRNAGLFLEKCAAYFKENALRTKVWPLEEY